MAAVVRRLLEWKPRDINEAHRVLQRMWPQVDYGVTVEAFAHYEAQTKAATKPETSSEASRITVTPIGAGLSLLRTRTHRDITEPDTVRAPGVRPIVANRGGLVVSALCKESE
jgi:hypothetical protein